MLTENHLYKNCSKKKFGFGFGNKDLTLYIAQNKTIPWTIPNNMALSVPDISVILFIVPGMTSYLNNAMSCMSGWYNCNAHVSSRTFLSCKWICNMYVSDMPCRNNAYHSHFFFFSFLFHTYFLKITAPKGGICKNGCFPMVRCGFWVVLVLGIFKTIFFRNTKSSIVNLQIEKSHRRKPIIYGLGPDPQG